LPKHPLKVLIADSDEDNLVRLTKWLRLMGFRMISTANDGFQALYTLKREDYDLLLLTPELPKISGVDVLRHLRRIPRFKGPKVIIMTKEADRKLIEKTAVLGVSDFLLKPFSDETLKMRAEKVLGHYLS
jgi:two-component system, chemotaxis family, chemotaxis protein CheY